jgi:hypothetical protein
MKWPDPYSEAFKHLDESEHDNCPYDEDAFYATDLENEDGINFEHS